MSKIKRVLSEIDADAVMGSINTMACTLIECQKNATDPKNMEVIATAALRAAVRAHMNIIDEIVDEKGFD